MGCGKKTETADDHAATESPTPGSQLPSADVTSQPGEEMAVQTSPMEALENVFIRPYFDEAGATQLAIAPGEMFQVHVFAETVDPCSTNAAQFRLDIPAGVRVIGMTETDQKTVSAGNRESNYMIAFACQMPGKFRIVSFECMAEPDFRGGEFTVAPGLPGGDETYLGFSTCSFSHAPAHGGSITARRK